MRVITGSARGHNLESVPGMSTRPTANSVKEAMMNIIQFELEGAQVLDLFAGTGQLGIETLSRGARSCIFVDQSRPCLQVMEKNLKHTKLEQKGQLVMANALEWIKATSLTFDIALLDPPYEKEMLITVLPEVVRRMSPNGVILCETSREEDLPQSVGAFHKKKEYHYGKRKITSYRQLEEE